MTRFCSDSDSFLGPFANMFSQVGMAKCASLLLFCSWPFSLDTSQHLQHCRYMETITLAVLLEMCFCSVSNIQYDFRMSRLIIFMLRNIIISRAALLTFRKIVSFGSFLITQKCTKLPLSIIEFLHLLVFSIIHSKERSHSFKRT